MIRNAQIRKYSDQLRKMYKQQEDLYNEYDEESELGNANSKLTELQSQINSLSKDIDDFIENSYSEIVYEFYKARKPDLIRIQTGETVCWDDAFGSSFKNISKSLRHSLVGLVEEPGRYRFK